MKIQLKRSNQLEGGIAKEPSVAQMEYGELAVNYNTDDPSLFIKDSADNIIKLKIAEGAQVLISDTAPNPLITNVGTLWWNSSEDSGQLFILYDDPAGGGGGDTGGPKWIEASPNTGGGSTGGAEVIVSPTAPVTDDLEEGSLWWNSDVSDLSMYVLYNDSGIKKWVDASPAANINTDEFVAVSGDNMTGALTIGPDGGPAVTTLADDGSATFAGKLFGGLHNVNHPGEASLNISGANDTKFIQFYDQVNTANNSFIYDNGYLKYDGNATFQDKVGIGTTNLQARLTVADGSLTINHTGSDIVGLTISRDGGTAANWYQHLPAASDRLQWSHNGTDVINFGADGSATFAATVSAGSSNNTSYAFYGSNNSSTVATINAVSTTSTGQVWSSGWWDVDHLEETLSFSADGAVRSVNTANFDRTISAGNSANTSYGVYASNNSSTVPTIAAVSTISTGQTWSGGWWDVDHLEETSKIKADGSATFAGAIAGSNEGYKLLLGNNEQTRFISTWAKGTGNKAWIWYSGGDDVDEVASITTAGAAHFASNVTSDGTIGFNLEPDNPDNYTTTTDSEGNETSVYSGPTLDVKERMQNLISRLDSLESDEIADDATSTLLLTTVNNLNAQMTKVNLALTAIRTAANAAGTLDQLKSDIAAATADI